MCSWCLVLSDHSERGWAFFSQTTLLEAMSQRKVVTTGWWASGCVQSGSEQQMAITAPLCQNKLLRAPGGVHSPETFSAISPILSHFDKLSPLCNNTLHHLSEGRLFPSPRQKLVHSLVQRALVTVWQCVLVNLLVLQILEVAGLSCLHDKKITYSCLTIPVIHILL